MLIIFKIFISILLNFFEYNSSMLNGKLGKLSESDILTVIPVISVKNHSD